MQLYQYLHMCNITWNHEISSSILQFCYKIKELFEQILMNVDPCRIVFTSNWMSMILTL
jgi:hypothetical protein